MFAEIVMNRARALQQSAALEGMLSRYCTVLRKKFIKCH